MNKVIKKANPPRLYSQDKLHILSNLNQGKAITEHNWINAWKSL